MSENVINILYSILSAEMRGRVLSESEKVLCTDSAILEVLNIAQNHDIAHLICTSLLENELVSENTPKYQSFLYNAIYRYQQQNYELERIRALLERIGVPFILLKGSVIRKFYPEPWMRTSCDIDILVRKADLDKAQNTIIQELGYERKGNSTHDISFFSKSGVCLELHFELKEPEFTEPPILLDIWNSQEIASVSEYEYAMSPELFLLYHIYHMAKHFIHGGCGIKPVVDLWIIKNKMGFDEEKAATLLKENDLFDFYRGVSDLADVWFENKEHSDITREMEDYILEGGVYGTLEQQLAMSQSRKGGKFKHLLSKIFLSYDAMLIYYPSLKKCPILFPFYQVRRWFRILFCGGSKRAFNEIVLNQNLSSLKKEKAKFLMTELGL